MSARRLTQAEKDARKAEREAVAKTEIDAYITRVVDALPPMANEQRDRLALLLRGAGPV